MDQDPLPPPARTNRPQPLWLLGRRTRLITVNKALAYSLSEQVSAPTLSHQGQSQANEADITPTLPNAMRISLLAHGRNYQHTPTEEGRAMPYIIIYPRANV